MADLALKTAARVEGVGSLEQMTLIAAEAITPGQAVRLDTASGQFTLSKATSAAEARIYGIAVGTHAIAAGFPVTAIRRGVIGGFTIPQAYDAAIFLSDTDGMLADAAGTVSTVVGRVIPGANELLGSAYGKLLYVGL